MGAKVIGLTLRTFKLETLMCRRHADMGAAGAEENGRCWPRRERETDSRQHRALPFAWSWAYPLVPAGEEEKGCR